MDAALSPQLLHQCSRSTPANIKKFWQPDTLVTRELEANLDKLLDLKAEGCCVSGYSLAMPGKTHTAEFGLQYAGIIIKGRRYIYINAFPYAATNFDGTKFDIKKPEVWCDGGPGLWGAVYDVETKTFSQLSFNGMG
jgi:hypothetical protein